MASYLAVISVRAGATVSDVLFQPQLFDLTEMFGAGNEPSTVSEFNSEYPDLYGYIPLPCSGAKIQILTSGAKSRITIKDTESDTVPEQTDVELR